MAKKTMYPARRELLLTKQQEKDGEKLADSKNITFNQLIRDLLDSAIRIEEITRTMK